MQWQINLLASNKILNTISQIFSPPLNSFFCPWVTGFVCVWPVKKCSIRFSEHVFLLLLRRTFLAPAAVCNCEIFLNSISRWTYQIFLYDFSHNFSASWRLLFQEPCNQNKDVAYIYLSIYLSLSAHYLALLVNIKHSHSEPISECGESVVRIVSGPGTCQCSDSGNVVPTCPAPSTKYLIMLNDFMKEVFSEPDTTCRNFHLPCLAVPRLLRFKNK